MTKRRVRTTFYSLTGLFWFSTAMITALYVLFLIEKGMNLAHVGIWAGLNTLTVILLEVPTGGLADAWGRGRTYSLANIIIASSLLFMVLVPGLTSLYCGAVLFGAGRALSSGSLDAWFIDSLKSIDPEADIESETGAAGAVVLSCLATGSLIGSTLPGLAGQIRLPSGISPLALPLAGDAFLKIVLAVLTLFLVKDTNHHGSPFRALKASLAMTPEIAGIALRTIRTQKILLWLFVGGAAVALGIGSIENFWQPRFLALAGEGTSRTAFGAVMAACFAGGAVVSLAAPRITRVLGGKRHLSAFLFTLALAAALIAIAASTGRVSTAIWMIVIYGLAEGASVPRKALLHDVLPSEVRATMLSVDSLITYVGFAGVVGLGFVAEARGIPLAWRLSGAGVLIMSFAYLPIGRRLAGEQSGSKLEASE